MTTADRAKDSAGDEASNPVEPDGVDLEDGTETDGTPVENPSG
jgi:hypothetical protein